jgi:hypothetical protein
MTILKYVLEQNSTLVVDGDIVPLTCDEQQGTPVMWVEHDETRNWRSHLVFFLLTTGKQTRLPEQAKYLGTIKLSNGTYILHCYYTKELLPRHHAEAGK